MPSQWGKKNDLPKYDKFRTNLSYAEVYNMLRTSSRHRHKRRGSVLGFWHEIKLQLYHAAVDLGYLDEKANRAEITAIVAALPDDRWVQLEMEGVVGEISRRDTLEEEECPF